MSEHNIYTGDEIINLSPDTNKPLIENIIWEKDSVILVGKPKSGKSILSQQMAFSISCGEPFLNEYKSYKGCCLYIQVEGKLSETRERIINMLDSLSWNSKNFNLIFYPGLAINTSEGLQRLTELIERKMAEGMPTPKLIIFDPLYMCVRGDLCNQVDASNMCTNLRILNDRYGCAILLIHHEHKVKFDNKGEIIFEGTGSIFGSFVWEAYPDHVLLLNKQRGGGRELVCDVQRSMRIKEKIEMALIQPVPLMFDIKGDVSPYIKIVEAMIDNTPKSADELQIASNLSYNSIGKALVHLRRENKIKSVDSFPKKWVKR